MTQYDISVVLGSRNRKSLLKATIESIRHNGFIGSMEIIVIDGGSTDGTCNWLSKQKDIFTIIQPNSKVIDHEGISVLTHSWGEFINIGLKYAKAPWIVMVSDDLILAKGTIQNGYNEMISRVDRGEKIGGGAFYFREYPRQSFYRVGLLPLDNIIINHGFFFKEALEDVSFIEEKEYNFYFADGDLAMRLNYNGWKTIAIDNCFADHLVHKPSFKKKKFSPATIRDMEVFNRKYPYPQNKVYMKKHVKVKNNIGIFWQVAFLNCLFGIILHLYDRMKNRN